MIDFHTHILPGIDDGSQSIEETEGLLREELRQGVEQVVATPHFYANRMSVEQFLDRRAKSIQLLEERIANLQEEKLSELKLRYGAEVYFFTGMSRAEKLPQLCITGTNLILIEMPFEPWTEDHLREIRHIIKERELRVVLAHVERYPEFQRKKAVFEAVLDLPLILQLNAGSFLKSRTKRKFCLKLLKEKENVILGTDTHNLSSRPPRLAEAREVIIDKMGSGRIDLIDTQMRNMLNESTGTF